LPRRSGGGGGGGGDDAWRWPAGNSEVGVGRGTGPRAGSTNTPCWFHTLVQAYCFAASKHEIIII
jgi:hypothetical protein